MIKRSLSALAAASLLFTASITPIPSSADTPQTLSMGSTSNCVAPSMPSGVTGIQVSGGTWTGAMVIQESGDATHYSNVSGVNASTGLLSQNITANGFYRVNGGGAQGLRVCVSTTGSNSASVAFFSGSSSGVVMLENQISSQIVASTPIPVALATTQPVSVVNMATPIPWSSASPEPAVIIGAGSSFNSPLFANVTNPINAINCDPQLQTQCAGVNGQGELFTTDPDVVNTAGSSLALGSIANAVPVSTNYNSITRFQITGTWTGTIIFEGTVNGTTWTSLNAASPGNGTIGPTTTSNGIYRVDSAGYTQVRARVSSTGTGTATVAYDLSAAIVSPQQLFDSSGNQYVLPRNGSNAVAIDANGVQTHKNCDATTSTQCGAVDSSGRVSVNFVNNPCINTIPTTIAISMATATTTQFVAANGSNRIYGCNLTLQAGGATNVTLVYGTGTNCNTGQNPLSGAMPENTNTGFTDTNFVVPASQAFCLTNSAAQQVSGTLSYVSAP